MKTLLTIAAIIILWIMFFKFSLSFLRSKYEAKKLLLEFKRADSQEEEEEIEHTCCGVEITEEIKDNELCPVCLEHI